MGADAVKDLRAWQREQASQQQRALRTAQKAKQQLEALDVKRATALETLTTAVATLEGAGLDRDQCAAFLDTTPGDLARLTGARRGSPGRQSPA